VSTRTEQSKLKNTNISALDILYGVGFYYDYNGSMIEKSIIDDYFIFKYSLSFNDYRPDKVLDYNKCNSTDFYEKYEYEILSSSEKDELDSWMKYYICPIRDQNVFLESHNFTLSSSFLSIKLDIRQDNFINAIDFLKKNRIFLSFTYSSYFIDIKNRFKPFVSQINEDEVFVDSYLHKKFYYKISPFQIYDDTSFLPNIDYRIYKDSNILNEHNSLYFSYDLTFNEVQSFPNRSSDDTSLINLLISLSDSSKTIYRSFPKFTNFLAGITTILDILFVLISSLANLVNKLFMKLFLSKKRMYTKNITEFKKEFLKNFDSFNSHSISSNKKKSAGEVIMMTEKNHLETENQITNEYKDCNV